MYSPGTAKNVIAVGAIELARNITNEVEKITGGVTNKTVYWQEMTSSGNRWRRSRDAAMWASAWRGFRAVQAGRRGAGHVRDLHAFQHVGRKGLLQSDQSRVSHAAQ